MAWMPTGSPRVRKQRDKWVVRVDGLYYDRKRAEGKNNQRSHPGVETP